MTERDLKKLDRRELLELLIAAERENARLKDLLDDTEALLRNREIEIERAGTLAEASLALTSIFEEADRAVALYTDNIRRCSADQEAVYNRIVAEAEQKAQEILAGAEEERKRKLQEADDYWKSLSTKLESFYQSHVGLRELLELQPKKPGGTK